ncbi:single-strand DNA endonuclease ASTE1-like [Mytilus galloprovincialis]|uniref:single-strand DNA endonuclease ASTE1-like n=1 Tax=Mytilus galloprovincialis TaxID=29158 RepID=UPI003F7C9C8D
MGIPGLTTLIDDNLQLLQDYQLHHSKVIIDGNNLYHLLFYSYNVGYTHGGDYNKFSRKIKEFFDILKSCDIEPYIILDGGYEPDDRKLKTSLERATKRILLSGAIINSDRGKILPILSYEVFMTALDNLGIPHVTCDFEADNQIAILANDFKCPVISFDSDFYVLNLTDGFIPFDSVNFEVQPTVKDSEGNEFKYLPVKKYFTKNFISCFPELDKEVLPLMATVLGNDYVNIHTFEEFYSALKIPKHAPLGITVTRTHTKMMKIMNWLESLKSIESGVNRLILSVKPERRDGVKELIKKSMDAYTNITTYRSFSLYDFFLNKEEPSKNYQTSSYNKNTIPSWFIDFHRQGKMPPFMQNTLVLHRNILQCQVEEIKMPSSYSCSTDLRQILYSILLRDELKNFACTEISKKFCVEEYDRQDGQKNVKKNLIEIIPSVEGYGDLPGLGEIEDMKCSRKRELLCKVFNLNFNQSNEEIISDDIILFIMAVIFWIRNADPKTNLHSVKTILVCWVALSARTFTEEEDKNDSTINASFTKSTLDQREKLKKNLEKYFHAPQHTVKHPIDISIIHGFAQFQSCFLSTTHLNQILGFPFPPVNPSSIFCGSFLYNFCKDLQTRSIPDLFISEMLVKQSPALSLFQNLMSFILSRVDEDQCLKTVTSSNKRTRNRKKKKSVTTVDKKIDSEDDESSNINEITDKSTVWKMKTNIKASCELSNRFNFLDIDDSDDTDS